MAVTWQSSVLAAYLLGRISGQLTTLCKRTKDKCKKMKKKVSFHPLFQKCETWYLDTFYRYCDMHWDAIVCVQRQTAQLQWIINNVHVTSELWSHNVSLVMYTLCTHGRGDFPKAHIGSVVLTIRCVPFGNYLAHIGTENAACCMSNTETCP